MLTRQPALLCLRTFQGRTSHASLAAGPVVFAEQHLWYTCVWAAEMLLGCDANWRLGCKLAFGRELAFRLQIGVWVAIGLLAAKWRSNLFENRPFGLSEQRMLPQQPSCGFCEAANQLRPCKLALRSFRARVSHSSLTAGPAVFADPQIDCVLANRPFGLFGHAHRMLPRQKPCDICGEATRLRPC